MGRERKWRREKEEEGRRLTDNDFTNRTLRRILFLIATLGFSHAFFIRAGVFVVGAALLGCLSLDDY